MQACHNQEVMTRSDKNETKKKMKKGEVICAIHKIDNKIKGLIHQTKGSKTVIAR